MNEQEGIPLKLLRECCGHIVSVEVKNGDIYLGTMNDCDYFWNCHLHNITHTSNDGKVSHIEHLLIRGSNVRYIVIPDMFKNAPMFIRKDEACDDGRVSTVVLSELPEEVIGEVLSRLGSTREAVATEVLSRSWINRWTLMDNLNISDDDSKAGYQAFVRFIDRTLHHIQNARTVSFCLMKDYDEMVPMNEWIYLILTRNRVRNLTINSPDVESLFPTSIMNITAIETLYLDWLTFRAITQSTFPNLKKLHLVGVHIVEESGEVHLVLHLPLVEEIKLELCTWGVSTVEFRAPSLAKFSTRTRSSQEEEEMQCRIVMSDVKLSKFYSRFKLEEFRVTGSCRYMAVKCMGSGGSNDLLVSGRRLRNLLRNFSETLEELKTAPFFIKALLNATLGNLYTKLPKLQRITITEFYPEDNGQEVRWEELVNMLKRAPNLGHLVIDVLRFEEAEYTHAEIPICVSSKLEEITLSYSDPDPSDGGLQLAGFFLRHARSLKKLYFKFPGLGDGFVRHHLAHFQRAHVLYSLS